MVAVFLCFFLLNMLDVLGEFLFSLSSCDLGLPLSDAIMPLSGQLAVANITHAPTVHELGPYIAGLIESDGWIITPKSERFAGGKLAYPSIGIVFNIKDLPLANYLCDHFGYGSIQVCRSSDQAVEWIINSKQGIVDLVDLINGHMRTPKVLKLEALINWIHFGEVYQGADLIQSGGLDTSPLGSNGWLAGFTDGDGSFQIRCTEGGLNMPRRIDVSYEFTQSRVDKNLFLAYRPIMLLISSFLLAKLGDRMRKDGRCFYLVRTSSQAGVRAAISYFKTFPLLSSKRLDFLAWAEAQGIMQAKLHHSQFGNVGFDRIRAIKGTINDSRTVYTWDHLNNVPYKR